MLILFKYFTNGAFILRQIGHLDGQVGRQVGQNQNKAYYDDNGTIFY